jgi:hypothetical protein
MNMQRLVTMCVAAALTACGGDGSSDDGSGPLPTISIDDSTRVGSIVTATNGALNRFAGTEDALTGPSGAIGEVIAFLRALRPSSPVNMNGTHTRTCTVSGRRTIDASIADPTSATLSRGDTLTLTYAACDDGLELRAGRLRVTITSSPDGAFFLDPSTMTPGVRYEMTLVATDFVAVDSLGNYTGIDGDMTVGQAFDVADGWLNRTITGSSLTVDSGPDGVATESASLYGIGGRGRYVVESGAHFETGPGDYWPTVVAAAFTARLCSTGLGGCLDAVTEPPFIQLCDDAFPYAGILRISDSANRTVQVTAAGDPYTLPVDAVSVSYDVGAGVQGPFATTWSCLDAVDSSGCFVP